MKLKEITVKKLSLAYFFLMPGLGYGILTSRMPALKEQINANEPDIGFLLLCFGIAGITSLTLSSVLLKFLKVTTLLKLAMLLFAFSMTMLGMSKTVINAAIYIVLTGLAFGIVDVCINILGVRLEKYFNVLCMGVLHSAYSIGGLLGSLLGSFFAFFTLSLFSNYIIVFSIYLILSIFALPNLLKAKSADDTPVKPVKKGFNFLKYMPFFIIFLGLINSISFAIEGSIAEWGSILLHEEKNASQSLSALLYASMCLSTTATRLMIDKIRSRFKDSTLILSGTIIIALAAAIGLYTHNPIISLIAFCFMGVGLAPISPILFSCAGRQKNISAESATSIVAAISYSGMLFFPPLIGFLANLYTLGTALNIVFAFTFVIALGALVIRKKEN